MSQLGKSLFQNPFRKYKKSGDAKAKINNQNDGTTDVLHPTSFSGPGTEPAKPTQPAPKQSFPPRDLWKTAYDQLDDEEQRILSTVRSPTNLENTGSHSQTNALISEIIRLIEEQYEKYQQKGNRKLRASCRKIINAALSFKDIISAVAAFDPTQHAASAWTIVSLGLTMIKNHSDLRDALFESSEYLADVLAQCAFIEKNFYLNTHFSVKHDLGNAMIRLYRAILQYTVQIRSAQDPSMGRKVLDCVIAITDQPLTGLKASVEQERNNIFQWIGLIKHLHREKEAENILCQIENLAESMKHLTEQFGLVNLGVAEGAFYDSYINEHEEFCLPNTRTELRSQISRWAASPEGKCIFWLSGMAGTGKSTIARTLAQLFQDIGQLGATFFFKRGEADRGNAKYLISTLTRQLVTRHRRIVPDVLNAIENDPNISSKFLSEQFDKLLFQPLLKLHLNQPITTVIVIDALDECDREDDIYVILRLLPRLQNVQSVRVRIILTSRPELPIRLSFNRNSNHQDLVLHELPKPVIEHDIRLFLEHKFSKIRNERLLPQEWPGIESMEKLVKMSIPLFIFAATVCRFIGDRDWLPEERLAAVLQDEAATSTSDIERTYLPVLNQLTVSKNKRDSEQLLREFQNIVGVIILLATPLSVIALARLTDIPQHVISNRLNRFHSVLNIPEESHQPVRILHLSFRDFLVNTMSTFHVDERETHQQITLHCLRVIKHGLKRNICGLPSYGIERDEIDSHIVNQYLSADLQYSCRYWVYHFEQSRCRISEFPILDFLSTHFLHWLEALSLMDILSEAVGMIDMLQAAVANTNPEISEFLYDARRFILRNIYVTSIAPLQLYYSGLVFSPKQSVVRKMYSNNIPKWIFPLPQVEATWSSNLQILIGHSDWVRSVTFSPDGFTLASGSNDGTIKLWDVKTGKELQSLTGHSDGVNSVAFSSDGLTLASGSYDKTIKLWNVKTGKELETLTGHLGGILSVVFSSDGSTLASGSAVDQTIKLWDVKTGKELETLTGHLGGILSVVFSSDGSTLASGSAVDQTIKLWDVKTGKELQTLIDHLSSIHSVAFSSDGLTLASGSVDQTIKLWDFKTGKELQTLAGHSHWVRSVTFSSNGLILASGSVDQTIKLWDVKTGKELQTYIGHSGGINSVAFSFDGLTLASGSDDGTIKLWDVKTGKELETLTGHSDGINSVVFSSDGSTLSSGSDDKTIRLWDVEIRKELVVGHSDGINSMVFSSDGSTLASGSEDKTIRLWDVKTGKELQTLTGHSYSVSSVAFSSDGSTLASSSDGSIRASDLYDEIKLWDVKTGKELKTLTGHYSCWESSVVFSPDGLTLASGSNDQTIKLWDVKTGKELETLTGHSDWISSMAFFSDGSALVSYSYNKIELWKIKNGKGLETLTGHLDGIRSVAFSSDGLTLVSGLNDDTIKLWDVKTGKELQTLRGHSDRINSVAFSSDGLTLASGSNDQTIKLWDVKTGKELQTLTAHLDGIRSVAFSSDGLTLASGSNDQTIKLWDVKAGKELQTLTGHSHWVNSMAFSSDGTTLASCSYHGITLWDFKTGKELQALTSHSHWVRSVAFSPDGSTLASGLYDDSIKLWDVKTGKALQTLTGHSSSINSMAFSSEDHPISMLSRRNDPDQSHLHPQISISNDWICMADDKLIYLPPDYRPYNFCSAVKGATIALGYSDGRVLVIGFHRP